MDDWWTTGDRRKGVWHAFKHAVDSKLMLGMDRTRASVAPQPRVPSAQVLCSLHLMIDRLADASSSGGLAYGRRA